MPLSKCFRFNEQKLLIPIALSILSNFGIASLYYFQVVSVLTIVYLFFKWPKKYMQLVLID